MTSTPSGGRPGPTGQRPTIVGQRSTGGLLDERATAGGRSRELAPVRQLSFSASEVGGLVLVSVGAFALPVVLPVIGLLLIWRSRTWRRGDKGVATALVVLPVLLVAGVVGFTFLLRSWNFS